MAFKAMKLSSFGVKPSLTLRNRPVIQRSITTSSNQGLKKTVSTLRATNVLCTKQSTQSIQQKRNFSSFPDPNVNLTEEQVMLRDTALRFAQEKLEPHAARWDEEQIFPIDVLKEAAQLGFGAIYVPEEVGGSAMGRTEAALIFEAMSGYCVSTTAYISIHNMCAGLIDKFGTPEQRKHYLPKLASMELLASYCLTEPGSGSDAASLVTKAVRQGNHFVLNGSKAFISGAGDTDVYLIMVRTGDNSPNGISCVLVEKGTPGLSFGKKEQKMGWNSQPTRAVILEDCKIPVTNLIGKEGEGFKIAMKALDGGRINIAACSLGAAQRCNDIAKDYIKGRKQFGKPLASFQAMQFQLADMACLINASRLMVRQAANMMDAQDPNATPYCAMAKLFTCDASYKVGEIEHEMIQKVVDNALQMHGGYGYLKDYPVERFLRDIRVHRILEGTDAVMRIIIARNGLKD